MDGKRHCVLIVVATLAVAGCDGGDETPPPDPQVEPEGVLLDSAREPLDRARQVEDIAAGRKSSLDERLADEGE
jgi:hypothetical protein